MACAADAPGYPLTAGTAQLREAAAGWLLRRLGVSVDPVEKQKEFKEVNHFPFPLISDTDKTVLQAFGQTGGTNGLAAREAYLAHGHYLHASNHAAVAARLHIRHVGQ